MQACLPWRSGAALRQHRNRLAASFRPSCCTSSSVRCALCYTRLHDRFSARSARINAPSISRRRLGNRARKGSKPVHRRLPKMARQPLLLTTRRTSPLQHAWHRCLQLVRSPQHRQMTAIAAASAVAEAPPVSAPATAEVLSHDTCASCCKKAGQRSGSFRTASFPMLRKVGNCAPSEWPSEAMLTTCNRAHV
jgi:hypothetical protein